jgi:uncharacterized UPF0160 family protein
MELKIATHKGIFHADEVTAIALLKLFTDDEISVTRLKHDTKDFSQYDMVIDIGRKFDGEKYFDHHQYKGGKSSAGLIWEYLGREDEYPTISKLIKMVDDNDVGITKAKPFEYSCLIKHFNSHNDIYGDEQENCFAKAVEFALTLLKSLKQNDEEIKDAQSIVNNSFYFEGNRNIIELERYTRFWSRYINGQTTPGIKAVVWEDEADGNWKVKIPQKRAGSFELSAKPLMQNSSMEFVHENGFFGVAKNKEVLLSYLQKQYA